MQRFALSRNCCSNCCNGPIPQQLLVNIVFRDTFGCDDYPIGTFTVDFNGSDTVCRWIVDLPDTGFWGHDGLGNQVSDDWRIAVEKFTEGAVTKVRVTLAHHPGFFGSCAFSAESIAPDKCEDWDLVDGFPGDNRFQWIKLP